VPEIKTLSYSQKIILDGFDSSQTTSAFAMFLSILSSIPTLARCFDLANARFFYEKMKGFASRNYYFV
jgi:hypothetical protein